MIVWSFFAPLLVIIPLVVVVVLFSKNKLNFVSALPLVLMSITLIIYLSTIITHNTLVGFWTIIISALVSIFIIVCKKPSPSFFKQLFSSGFCIFLILYVILFIINYNRQLVAWDDFMHWAPFVKDILNLNDFYTSPNNPALLTHIDYPPAVPLWQSFWCYIAGEFREGFLFLSLELLCFSLLLPAFSSFKNKSLAKTILATLLLLTIVFSITLIDKSTHNETRDNISFYMTIYLDALLAFIFAYGTFISVTESKTFKMQTIIKLSILTSFTLLSKQSAIFFAGFIILIYITMLMVNGNFKKILRSIKKKLQAWKTNYINIIGVFLVLALPCICIFSWQVNVSQIDRSSIILDDGVYVNYQFSIKDIDPFKIPAVLDGEHGDESQQFVAKAFPAYVFYNGKVQIPSASPWFNSIPHIIFMFILIALLGLLWFFHKQSFTKRNFIALSIILFVGWSSYLFLLYCTYLFGGFRDWERFGLTSIARYTGVYPFAIILLIFMLFVYLQNSKSLRNMLILFVALWGLVFDPTLLRGFVSNEWFVKNNWFYNRIPEWHETFQKAHDIIKQNHDQPANILSTTATTDQYPKNLYIYASTYYARPNTVNYIDDTESDALKIDDLLRKNNYFIAYCEPTDCSDPAFQAISSITENDNLVFKHGELYKINLKNDQIKLELLN
ncbi:MAG: hypothetical protein LBQ02_01280 [Candidatus Nomurabacteria bacterium]|jgi:hypothetical protein|nr:hypothetical protein [Candidatus Nomurabacteria bacterium]